MFTGLQQLTKAEKKAKKLEQEAREFAANGAVMLVEKNVTRDDPLYANLSEEEFQEEKKKMRAMLEKTLFAMCPYYWGEEGQIMTRIIQELSRRCGDKKLAEELVRNFNNRMRDKKTLMNVLIGLLQNHELCQSSDIEKISRQWEQFVEHYQPEIASEVHLQELRRQRIEAERIADKAERLMVEETHRREAAERRAEEEAQNREAAERLAAEEAKINTELKARLDRYETYQPDFFSESEKSVEQEKRKRRLAEPKDNNPEKPKKPRRAYVL